MPATHGTDAAAGLLRYISKKPALTALCGAAQARPLAPQTPQLEEKATSSSCCKPDPTIASYSKDSGSNGTLDVRVPSLMPNRGFKGNFRYALRLCAELGNDLDEVDAIVLFHDGERAEILKMALY